MKFALVTGGNKGIGLAACKGLAAVGFHVFMGCRDLARGKKAGAGLNEIEPIELDVSKEASIAKAAKAVAERTDHLDVLVNNAGIFIDDKASPLDVDPHIILETFTTNTLGPLLVTRAFLPLLTKSAQVINVSSGMGQLSEMSGGSAAYRISKTALNAVTRILSAELSDKQISVNSICPGWVKTDMGGESAPRTPQQGADTIIWLAQGNAKASGKFYRDRQEIPW